PPHLPDPHRLSFPTRRSSDLLERPGLALLAPQAAGGTWYPRRFLDPVESNEPWLSAALGAVGNVVGMVEEAGVPAESILLLGFSQGACLRSEERRVGEERRAAVSSQASSDRTAA